ncbi:hypothetical protein J9D08_003448 [Salmonella enterica]|nr:hypothetical protein [Salmonella enterica subsp. enterica]EHI2276927.1 hypothetical protein [Salmonella enterica]EIF2901936.1 hypothetical protein [Salmonella enterica subsp. enterica serovar Kottbus]EJJ8487497.1 hypothetical protein [Salmonella enterica]ELU2959526.1 hypothetical protein [Salmonella enterica]
MNQLDARTFILKNACWFGMTAAGENIALTEFIFLINQQNYAIWIVEGNP